MRNTRSYVNNENDTLYVKITAIVSKLQHSVLNRKPKKGTDFSAISRLSEK